MTILEIILPKRYARCRENLIDAPILFGFIDRYTMAVTGPDLSALFVLVRDETERVMTAYRVSYTLCGVRM